MSCLQIGIFLVLMNLSGQHVAASALAQMTTSFRNSSFGDSQQNATATASCVTCAIFLNVGLTENVWWNSAISATLATIQHNITQYENTAVTNYYTIYNGYNSLFFHTEDPVIRTLSVIFGLGPYGNISFLDATTVTVPNGLEVTSPTAYNEYSYFQYYTLDANHDGTGDCLTDIGSYGRGPFYAPTITLSTTLYQVVQGGALDYANVHNYGDIGYQTFPPEFHEYILSNSALLASYPFLKTCQTFYAHGVPSVKVRVSALTSTNYNIIMGSGAFTASSPDATLTSSTSAAPASMVKAPAAPSTTAQPKQAISSSTAAVGQPSTVVPSSAGNEMKGTLPPIDTGTLTHTANAESKSSTGLGTVVPDILPTTANQGSYSSGPSVTPPIAGSNAIAPKPHDTAPSASTAPVIVVQGQSVTADSTSNYAVGTQMLVPGGSAITINNVHYSLAPSATALISAISTIPLSSPSDGLPRAGPPVINLGNQEYTANSASQYVVGTQYLTPGGEAVTVNNIPYSIAPPATALVSGSTTIPLSPVHNGAPDRTTVGSIPTADPVSGIVIDTQTLLPGSPAQSINGVLYSLAPSATALVSGSYTIPLAPDVSYLGPAITIGGTTYTANSASQYMIGTQTLMAGAHAMTIDGTPYSLAPSATAIVSGSITIPLGADPSHTAPPITIAGTSYTANSASQYIIGTQTLIPNGGSITINSTPYALSVGPSAEALYVGTSTSFVSPALQNAGSPLPTISLSPNPADPSHGYIIDGQTLAPGSEITVGGTKISLGAQGTDVVIGGTTEAVGLGGVIMSGFGAGPTAPVGNTSGGVVGFTGGTSGKLLPRRWSVYGIVMIGLLLTRFPS